MMLPTSPPPLAPGPSGVPLLGNLFAVQRDPLHFLERITAEYGGVVRYPVAKWQHLYLITDPEGVKQVLVTHQQHYSIDNRNRRALKLVMGEGLFVSEGDLWLRQRRLMQPAFHRHHVAALATQMSATIQERLDRWEEAVRRGEALNLSEEMMHLALALATRTLFGVDVSGEAAQVGQAVNALVQVYTSYARSPAVMLPNRVVALHPRFRAPLQALDAVVQTIIAERRAVVGEPTDTLSLLLALRDEETGAGMSDQQVRDEVMSLLIAGHETTARAMTWLWYLLSLHPEAEARVREEVEQGLAGRLSTAEDLLRLDYTRRVVEETLRLYPPAWVTFRKALVADEIAGYPIPAGARITLSPYVTHRRPDLWEEPERFDPDRFLPERSAARHPFAYFPFGGGPRQCIGRAMAMMQMQLMLALVMQRFRLLRVGTKPLRPVARLTLQPDRPLWMVAERV